MLFRGNFSETCAWNLYNFEIIEIFGFENVYKNSQKSKEKYGKIKKKVWVAFVLHNESKKISLERNYIFDQFVAGQKKAKNQFNS